MKTQDTISKPKSEIDLQKEYVQSIKSGSGEDLSFFVTETVMESMRDNGYRDVRKALNDLIDNSQQAGASKIAVVSTTAREVIKKNAIEKISNIAVIDNGHGMIPDMLSYAIRWGGTHRHNQRTGLGRFGFGLPTASISVTRTYEVYSKVKGGDWHVIRVDLDQIAKIAIASAQGDGAISAPKVVKATLPDFVKEYIKKIWKENDLEQGTVIALLNPDRIRRYARPQKFQQKMLHNLGLTYRHFIPKTAFYVNDKKVEIIDPLFLNPACIGYDVGNGIKAEGYDEVRFRVKNKQSSTEVEGTVTLRFSFMPPGFQNELEGERKLVPTRFNTMKENNGYFIVCRAGRQIDVVKESNYTHGPENVTIINYDRNWAIELDFDPILDELFGITTNKQQVEIDDSLWDSFSTEAIPSIVKSFRDKWKKMKADKAAEDESEIVDRDSEQVMTESEKFDHLDVPEEKKEEAEKNKRSEATRRSKKNKTTVKQELENIDAEVQKSRYKFDFSDNQGAPFYSVEMLGPQMVLKLNTAHRFYTDVYMQQERRGKTALELLLMILGKCEVESSGDKLTFYRNERYDWSRKLDVRLEVQDRKDAVVDKESAEDSEQEEQPGE